LDYLPTWNNTNQYLGTYSKLRLVEDMGNGRSSLLFVTGVTGSTLHAAQVVSVPTC
jgi:hypothetical protein